MVCPALWPPWYRTTIDISLARRSVSLPFPSSPHWVPTTTVAGTRVSLSWTTWRYADPSRPDSSCAGAERDGAGAREREARPRHGEGPEGDEQLGGVLHGVHHDP